MNPNKVERSKVKILTDLPNIGKASAKDLQVIGIQQPSDLVGKSPLAMYDALCERTGVKHDPCVLDVFMSITHFMQGEDPQPWWHFTDERKQIFSVISQNNKLPL